MDTDSVLMMKKFLGINNWSTEDSWNWKSLEQNLLLDLKKLKYNPFIIQSLLISDLSTNYWFHEWKSSSCLLESSYSQFFLRKSYNIFWLYYLLLVLGCFTQLHIAYETTYLSKNKLIWWNFKGTQYEM